MAADQGRLVLGRLSLRSKRVRAALAYRQVNRSVLVVCFALLVPMLSFAIIDRPSAKPAKTSRDQFVGRAIQEVQYQARTNNLGPVRLRAQSVIVLLMVRPRTYRYDEPVLVTFKRQFGRWRVVSSEAAVTPMRMP